MNELKFIDLHVHTNYSKGHSLTTIDELVQRALEFEMPALAIADSSCMSGIPEFYLKCKEEGIKPILGAGFYFEPSYDSSETERKYHIVLLAKNIEGYRNLLKLNQYSYTDGFNKFPKINMDAIEKYNDGLICLSGGLGGIIDKLLESDDKSKAIEVVQFFLENLGEENFYIELQSHELKSNKDRMIEFINFSLEADVSIVVTGGSFYLMRTDATWCNELRRNHQKEELAGNAYYFKSSSEILKDFSDYEEGVKNTNIIADMCNVTLDEEKLKKFNFTNDDDELENIKKQLKSLFNE